MKTPLVSPGPGSHPEIHRNPVWHGLAPFRLTLASTLLLALTLFTSRATAAPPVIASFGATEPNLKPGESTTLSWTVTGADTLSIDQGIGSVGGSGTSVTPAQTVTYTLTASNSDGTSRAETTVNVSPLNYLLAYNSGLQGTWRRETWEAAPLFTDFAASAPGRTGNAIEVRFSANNGYNAFGIGDVDEYLNEFRTFEFDIYFEADSTGEDELTFILGDAGFADEPRIVDLIPGWAAMSPAQKLGHWHHATLTFADLHPKVTSANRFLWFNNGTSLPHFRLADVKLGWSTDTVAPSVTAVTPTYDPATDQLTLRFNTDEPALFRVEYGVTDFAHSVQGDYHDWSTNHTAVLTEVTPGTINQYRILLADHHTDPNVDSNLGTYSGTFAAPVSTNAPRAIIPASVTTHTFQIYGSALASGWGLRNWETGTLFSDFAATAPGRAGTAIEVRFGNQNHFNGFGVGADDFYFNEFRTLEFDIYFDADSTGNEDLGLVIGDGGFTDNLRLVDLIPGWFTLTHAQRFGHWFHVAVDFPQVHPRVPAFNRLIFFNNSENLPHFRLADMKMGWLDDLTAPVITLTSASLNPQYTQLTLGFRTDETTLYRIEYGTSDYSRHVEGAANDWATVRSIPLDALTPGSTVQYRIIAWDHRYDPMAVPNQSVLEGTYVIPPAPVTAPLISSLAVDAVAGTRATLVWHNNRPCTAQLTYHKAGGPDLTRHYPDLVSDHAAVMDLLEPLTSYVATVNATDAFGNAASQSITFTTTASSASTVSIAIDPASTRPISPWIYGINFYHAIPDAPRNLTLNRAGGNRWTAYNWENNASNAGNDWFYSSDDYLGGGLQPGEALRSLIDHDRSRSNASLVTLQLQGYVAADKNGFVDIYDPNHLSNRFKQVVYHKDTPFSTTPDLTDPFVYIDEFFWNLGRSFATDIFGDPNVPTFVTLDNEPELWPDTHAEIQSGPPGADDYIQRSIALSSALKNVSPAVQIFGPAHYGFLGLYNWQMAAGFNASYWFTDKYLGDMKAASDAAGHRLLDVYDFHWYSEARVDGKRIGGYTNTVLSNTQIQGIVQSPRSLWDPTYRENSWVADALGGPIHLLDRLQAKIDATWPGTKLAISEYGNGGDNHIAGAIAEADNLGIFGAQGVFQASFWPTSPSYPFILAGFKMYRDYDGNLGSFGDISLSSVSSDPSLVSTYVSHDSQRTNRYVLVAINRSVTVQDVAFNGLGISGAAKLYRVEGTQTTPVFVGETVANLNTWVVTLPALSVTTIEILDGQATGSDPTAPIAVADALSRPQSTRMAKVRLTDLLANDSSPAGLPLSIAGVGNATPPGATVEIVGNFVVYTAPTTTAGNGGFEYILSDGSGGHHVQGTVTVTQTASSDPANDAPNPLAISRSGNDIVVTFLCVPGGSYRVQYTTDSGPYTWHEFASPAIHSAATNGVFSHRDVQPPDPVRFYRAVSNP